MKPSTAKIALTVEFDTTPLRDLAESVLSMADSIDVRQGVITHRCPERGSNETQCCSENPFALPMNHRLTLDPLRVTCGSMPEGPRP